MELIVGKGYVLVDLRAGVDGNVSYFVATRDTSGGRQLRLLACTSSKPEVAKVFPTKAEAIEMRAEYPFFTVMPYVSSKSTLTDYTLVRAIELESVLRERLNRPQMTLTEYARKGWAILANGEYVPLPEKDWPLIFRSKKKAREWVHAHGGSGE